MPEEHKKNKEEILSPRPPVVAVMGHVDHGKSTLLEYIRKINITEKEAGGITQKIGAYEIEFAKENGEKKAITFLDTPGHEAFGAIRSRGANVADIAILVVSAEDGVKPQTLDAYSCIKKAEIPFIVAINKIDKPQANIEQTKQSLAEKEIYLEGYGGDIPWVAISAKKGDGISELLELIILIAEMNELKGDPNLSATGFIIEANQDSRRGPSATIIIKDGSLKIGEVIVAGNSFAPLRILENDRGQSIEKAVLGMPIRVIGWSKLPEAGVCFQLVANKKEAETIIEKNSQKTSETKKHSAMENAVMPAEAGKEVPSYVVIPVIIKADATGTIDAIKHEIKKIETEKVKIKIVSEGVGNVSESDAKTAESFSNAVIIAFNVIIDNRANTIIERSAIEIKQFDIIYKLSEWLSELAALRTPKTKVEQKEGQIKVLKIFSKEKDRQIIGGKVLDGQIKTGDDIKIFRREAEIGRGKIRELQKQKTRVDEVAVGFEFGALAESKVTIAPGDIIEPFTVIER